MKTNPSAKSNVFVGPNAIRDYLNPRNVQLPLVELCHSAFNPFKNSRVRIFGSLLFMNPLFNLKLFPVYHMLEEAKKKGLLKDVHTLIEASSGNTAAALGILAPHLTGIKNIHAILSWDLPANKREILRLLGVAERLFEGSCPDEARRAGAEKGYFNLAQYDNGDNPKAFKKFVAPSIWEGTEGKMTVCSLTLGTAGTAIGLSEYFEEQAEHGSSVHMVGVSSKPRPSYPVPGVRTAERLKEITLPWQQAIDERVEVEGSESFTMSNMLMMNAILAGPSSGAALVGLHRFLESWRAKHGSFVGLENKDGEVVAVAIFADTFFPYMEKYSRDVDSWLWRFREDEEESGTGI